MNKKQKYWKIYLFIFLYVGLGTISVLASYPSDLLYCGQWMMFVELFTLPVNTLSLAYRFTDANNIFPVLIIQSIVLVICLASAYLICRKKSRQPNEQ